MSDPELKEAIIMPDKKIKCPYCYKTNGMVNENAFVRNYIIRCKGSRRGHEHYFCLNVGSTSLLQNIYTLGGRYET